METIKAVAHLLTLLKVVTKAAEASIQQGKKPAEFMSEADDYACHTTPYETEVDQKETEIR